MQHGSRSDPTRVVLTLGLALMGAMFPARASAQDATALPGDTGDWSRIEMDHFTVVTNQSAKKAIEFAHRLERLRGVLGMLATDREREAIQPLHLVIFDDDEDFDRYRPYYEGRPVDVVGWFLSTEDGDYMAVDASKSAYGQQVLYHEFVHSWIAANLPLTPLWLNEGLAEFYSSFAVDDDEVLIGRTHDRHLATLTDTPWLSTARLIDIEIGNPEYNERDRQGIYYAQSWLLVHHIMTNKELRSGLMTFLRRVDRGENPSILFEDAFGVPLQRMVLDLKNYLAEEKFAHFRLAAKKFDQTENPRVTSLTEIEALMALGDLISHLPQAEPGLAESHFQAVLSREPDHAAAFRGLGLVRVLEDRPPEALDLLNRALELDPQDVRTLVLTGNVLVGAFTDSTREGYVELQERTPPRMARARELFRRALEISPDDPTALAGLGRTFAVDRDPAEGIDCLTRACEAMPWRTDLVAELFLLQLHASEVARARDLFETNLRRRLDRGHVKWAEGQLVRAEIEVASQLHDRGEVEEAEAMMQRIRDRTEDSDLRELLDARLRRRAAIESGMAEVGRLNEAANLANRGSIEEALVIAEELASDAEQDQVRSNAEKMAQALRVEIRVAGQRMQLGQALELIRQERPGAARRALDELLAEDDLDPEVASRARMLLRGLSEE